MARVLIVGNINDEKWVGALIRYVKAVDSSIQFDVFNTQYDCRKYSNTIGCCNVVCSKVRHYPKLLYKIPKVRGILFAKDSKKSFKKYILECNIKGICYNIVNFQFLQNDTLCLVKNVRSISNKVVLSPWGSDVLRTSRYSIKQMKDYAQLSDYIVTTENERFNGEVKSRIGNEKIKYIHLDLGSEVIDNLITRLNISKEESKSYLGLNDDFIIEIGYNGSTGQNHLKVISALEKIKQSLPSNTCIVLPLTYGLQAEYKEELVKNLNHLGLRYKLYTEFLSVDEVFYLRRCTDIFIHAQKTDANSMALAEYMICGTTIINGSWLSYENREAYGKPYYEFSSFEELASTITKAYNEGTLVKPGLVENMKKLGWNYWAPLWAKFYTSNDANI